MLFIVFPHYGVSIGRNDVRSALLQECHLALRTRDTKQQWQKFSWFWNGTFRRKVWWWFQHVDVSIPVEKDESHGPMFPNEFTQPEPGLCACVLMLKLDEIILVDHLFAHLRQRSEMVSTSVHMKHLGPRRTHTCYARARNLLMPQLADARRCLQESLERREELLTQQEQLAAARWIPGKHFSALFSPNYPELTGIVFQLPSTFEEIVWNCLDPKMGGLRRLKIKMNIFFGPIGILDPHMPAQFSQNQDRRNGRPSTRCHLSTRDPRKAAGRRVTARLNHGQPGGWNLSSESRCCGPGLCPKFVLVPYFPTKLIILNWSKLPFVGHKL